jgi:hypothetical protein
MPARAVDSPTAVTRTRTAESVATVPAVTESPLGARHGLRLARDHRLVELRPTRDDLAVGGDAATWAYEHDVADLESVERDPLRLAVADALGHVRQELRERRQRAAGLTERLHLLPVAEEHHHDQRRELPPELEVDHAELREHARHEGDRDRERDEQHHPGRTPAKLVERACQEDPAAVDEDHRAEHRRDETVTGELGRGEAEPVLDHLAVEDDRDGEDQRDPEATPVDVRVTGMAAVAMLVTVTAVLAHPATLRRAPMAGSARAGWRSG